MPPATFDGRSSYAQVFKPRLEGKFKRKIYSAMSEYSEFASGM
jgi:hypothetical protein